MLNPSAPRIASRPHPHRCISSLMGLALLLGATGGMARAATVKPSQEAVRTAGSRFDFALWDELLRRYVDDKGRVDYARLKATADDARKLDRLYAQVGAQRLEALGSKDAKQAFLIDAYNVCVWVNVLMRLPGLKDLGGKLDQTSFFYATDFIVAGRTINLKKLEDDEVRARFKDPRVHFALNCASGGCPLLPNEAFTPERLGAQLDRETRRFCNEDRNVAWDPARKVVRLSKIFEWYAGDFNNQVLAFINKWRARDRQIPATAKIEYVDYDWRLNDRSLPR